MRFEVPPDPLGRLVDGDVDPEELEPGRRSSARAARTRGRSASHSSHQVAQNSRKSGFFPMILPEVHRLAVEVADGDRRGAGPNRDARFLRPATATASEHGGQNQRQHQQLLS